MSSKSSLQDLIRQVRKARIALDDVEEQLYEYLEDKFEIKEELTELLELIIENVDKFDETSTVETLLTACTTKPATTRAQRRNAGKKTKEEVIQTVKERERRQSSSNQAQPAATIEEVD